MYKPDLVDRVLELIQQAHPGIPDPTLRHVERVARLEAGAETVYIRVRSRYRIILEDGSTRDMARINRVTERTVRGWRRKKPP